MPALLLNRSYSPSEICSFEKRLENNVCVEIERFFVEENDGLIVLKDRSEQTNILYNMTWDTFLFLFLLGKPATATIRRPHVPTVQTIDTPERKESENEHSM